MKALWTAIALGISLASVSQVQAQQPPQSYGSDTVKRSFTIVPRDIDKQTLGGGTFCLTVLYRNNYYYYYSENYAEANTTDGPCESNGPRTDMNIALNWKYNGDRLQGKSCDNTSQCDFSERNYGIGKKIDCASATAGRNGWSARVSTDPVSCP
ncbi:hypothetical protein [Xanthobacter aminoxidans]|uniref:Secreted protein n=1 Tax=Xanthobacter aminoxidans TaxID=186280 RepID=A0ABW6ZNK8_9HYPH